MAQRGIGGLRRSRGVDLGEANRRAVLHTIPLTAVLIGLYCAVRTLPIAPDAVTLVWRLTWTAILFAWGRVALTMCRPLLEVLARRGGEVEPGPGHWGTSRAAPVLENFGRVLVLSLTAYALMKVWSLDLAPWFASAGVVGLAFGFAARESLANLFAGLSILIDGPYQVGHYINLETGERGEVTRIGLRSTRILTRDDLEITVPNGRIAAARVTNESQGRWRKSRVRAKVGVAYGSDIARVKQVLEEVAGSVQHALEDPAPRTRVRALGDSAVQIELLVWIDSPELRGRVIDALLTQIHDRFRAEEISIPFPQRDLHIVPPKTASEIFL
jgi:small-conductance mechanosensitive channel